MTKTARAALLAMAVLVSIPDRADAAEHLLAAFHLDIDMGTFIMREERSFGMDVQEGPLRYIDPYFNMWITGGVQFRPHPMVALDLTAGIARWTGSAVTNRGSSLFWWSLDRVFRVRNYMIPIELSVIVSVMEAPQSFIGICIGPGLYIVRRYVEAKHGVEGFASGLGGGGKLSLIFGTRRKGPFEFNFEIGFRITRFAKMKAEGGVETGDHNPDFSGPFLGFKLMLGGGTSDPAPPAPLPEPAPAPAPVPAQPVVQPVPVVAPAPAPGPAPLPPSGG